MQNHFAAIVCAGLMLAIVPARADTPVPGVLPTGPSAAETGDLGKELTVQNWIICTTEANAESIAKARSDGVEPAFKAYTNLQASKACGMFPVLKVILRQSLYESAASAPHATRVYRASVNIGSDWPTAFVISGALAE
jgi:hypothetical protein